MEESKEAEEDETKLDSATQTDTDSKDSAEEPKDAEKEEEKSEEPKLNTEVLEFTDSINSVNVKITAEPDTFPEGTEMKVTEVSKEEVLGDVESAIDENVKDVKAVDITFYANGIEVQPAKKVKVELTTSAFQSNEDLKVVHIEEPGKAEEMTLTESTDTKAEFTTDGFSVYVVVDTGEDATLRLVVEFENFENSNHTQIYVKQGDALNTVIYDPGAGSIPSNVSFKGWTTDSGYTVNATTGEVTAKGGILTIANVRDAVEAMLPPATDGQKVTYYPVLVKAYNIDYLDEHEASLGRTQVFFRYDAANATPSMEYTVEMGYTPQDTNHDFQGWKVFDGSSNISDHSNGKTYTNSTVIHITGDVVFSVNAPEGHWLVFNENGKGGTYNAPQFVLNGQITVNPVTVDNPMLRNGYTFGGWYTDAACTEGNEFSFGNIIDETTHIYAKWNPIQNANYTVLIWLENLAGDGYDFEESISLTGGVNTTINTVTSHDSGNSRYASVNNINKQYTGFHLKEFDQNVNIVPEGSSVVNVYYERTTYTLTFRRYETYGTVYKTITEKYGHSIKDNFPIDVNGNTEYRWEPHNSSTFKQVLVYIDIMPAENVTFTRKYMEFYVEVLPGQTGTRTFNGKSFVKLGNTIPAKYNYFTEAEDFIELTGYNKFGSDPAFGNNGQANVSGGGTLRLYYTRKAYTINFMDGIYVNGNNNKLTETNRGQLQTIENVLYESNVESYNTHQPPTDKIPEGFVFEGWYLDDACTQKNNFTTMPEGGITVYAKWRQIQYRVFLHPNAGTDPTLDWGSDKQEMNFRIPYGGNVSTPTGLRSDYEFVGWYTDSACTKSFNKEVFILNNSTVTDTYNKSIDNTDVMDKWGNGATWNSDLTGWDDDDDPDTPGKDRFWITRKLDLYAKWRSKLQGADGIGIIYDAAEGSNPPSDSRLYVDQAKATAGTASTGPEGKVFDKWEIQTWSESQEKYVSVGDGLFVYPGETFTVERSKAKIVLEGGVLEDGTPKKSYTIQLKAIYKNAENEVKTHIYWYLNDGSAGPQVQRNENISINEFVSIPPAPERAGYTFDGWVKVTDPTKPDEYAPNETLSNNDLFLVYHDGSYYRSGDTAFSVEATLVAAEAETEALLAKWTANTNTAYKVEHYLQNLTLDGYDLKDTDNLTG
ncbi:MAG: InlB B-repeat-containing protein, partial [Lachnospiraceae bacterium]|nr:InlB B-repeat-containing protein [Lachnospiraceae bacterium]